jgi:hypothetical protein
MASDLAKPSSLVEVTAGYTRSRQGKEEQVGEQNQEQQQQPTTAYMQGWALVFLTAAFMAICFVLALDNTILGLQTSLSA